MYQGIPDIHVTATPVTHESGGHRSGFDYELAVGETGFPSIRNIDNTILYKSDFLTLEEMENSTSNSLCLLHMAALPIIQQFKIKKDKSFLILTDCPPSPEVKLRDDLKELTDTLKLKTDLYCTTYGRRTREQYIKLEKEIKELEKEIRHKRNTLETMPKRKRQPNRFIAIQLNRLLRVLIGVNSGRVYYGIYQSDIQKWGVVRNPARIKSFFNIRRGRKVDLY
jgi:hypothetical protein